MKLTTNKKFATPISSRKNDYIALDFETAYSSKYSVKEMGVMAYVNDERFMATQVAAFNDVFSGSFPTHRFNWQRVHDKVIIAHNAAFDMAVFNRLQELGQIPHDIKPKRWLCTSALSRFLNGPSSLAECAKEWLGEEVDKGVRDRMAGQMGDLFDDIASYALNDARVCWKLWVLLEKAWPEHERKMYEITRAMGNYGVCLDVPYIDDCVNKLSNAAEHHLKGLPWVARGKPALSVHAFKEWCGMHEVTPPKSTAKMDENLDKWKAKYANHPAVQWLEDMQGYRRKNRTIKVFESMKQRIAPHGRMAYELMYCGAATGRWSGAGGVNMQNFNRDEVLDGVDLRSAISVPEGMAMIICDLAQIESRVLLWLAGDHDTLDILRTGIDIYEAHARATMNYTDKRPLKDVDKYMRQLAKARVLGLGYGCGAEKFITVAKIMGGLDITFEDSKRMVDDYRRANPMVTDLWNRLERAFASKDGGTYKLPLPSGRRLRYYNVDSIDMTAEAVRGHSENFYGGKLCENFVSAVARDILAESWLKMHDAGLKVIMSVHDELVVECHEAEADEIAESVKKFMSTPPNWASDLPLAVEAKITNRYEK